MEELHPIEQFKKLIKISLMNKILNNQVIKRKDMVEFYQFKIINKIIKLMKIQIIKY